jgi:hypothetical protein
MTPAPMTRRWPGTFVLLEEIVDAGHVGFHRGVLVGHHGGKVELGGADVDAELFEAVTGFLEELGGVQQGFGRNAAGVEAGAAMGAALVDHGDLEAELGGADGADVTAGSGADHHEIIGSHVTTFQRGEVAGRAGRSRGM